jgi:lipopolysaccharide/colanic/teichoic acid biosynthesis glycosyltransferase
VSRFPGAAVPAKWASNRNRAPLTRKEIVAKRALDLLLAGMVLVILSPLLGLICLGIKLEGRSLSILLRRGAAFNGREFDVYNFTTTAWEGACIGQGGRNDSRVTRVGRLLRAHWYGRIATTIQRARRPDVSGRTPAARGRS